MSWGPSKFPGGFHPAPDLSVPGPALPGAPLDPAPPTTAFRPQFILARLFDQLAGGSAGTRALVAALKADPDLNFSALIAGLPEKDRKDLRDKLGSAALAELTSLGAEPDFELFAAQWLRLAGRLEAEHRSDAAVALLQGLLPELGQGQEGIVLRAQAERDLQAILGQGAMGPRFEVLARRFAREASDPWMIAGFGVGSLAFKTTKLAVLSRLSASPSGIFLGRTGAGLLAAGAGLAAEVPAFVLTSKLGREITGTPQDWRPEALSHEFAATGLTLFCLKGTGFLSAKVVQSWNGIGGQALAAREFGAISRIAQRTIPQLGMFGGIILARRAEEWLGLRPKLDGATLLTDSLVTYFQFVVGGRLAEQVMGPRFHAAQRELELLSANLTHIPRPPLGFAMPEGLSPAAAGAVRIPRPTLHELISAPLMSENKNGDGAGNGRRGAPHLRSVAPGESRAPESEASIHDPEAFAAEVRVKIRDERQSLSAAMNALRSMSGKVETFIIHAAQGRGGGPEVKILWEDVVATYDRFLQKYLEVSRSHQAWIPLTAGSPSLQAETVKTRAETQRFLERAGKIHQEAQKILNEMANGDPEQVHAALRGLHQKIPELTAKPDNGALEEETPSQERLFLKLSGILQGVAVKEAYRGTPEEMQTLKEFQLHSWNLLGRGTPRAQDHQIPEWLLAELRTQDTGIWDPADTLITRDYPREFDKADVSARELSPREILRWGGSYQDPFRTWIGIQLPTLVAAYRGNLPTIAAKTRALEIFMEPKTQEATRVAAWWLSKALHSEGYPHEWAREPDASPLAERARRLAFDLQFDPERANRQLGSDSDMAVVGHALLAFLKHSFEPRAALEHSLNAPEGIREDVVSLTGALLGAFHGKGVFHPEWMMEVILRSVPTRKPGEAVREVTEFINKSLLLQNALEDLRNLAQGDGKSAKVTPLRPVPSRAEDPAWKAFRIGYEERYHNGEMIAVEMLWDLALRVEQARETNVYPKDWKLLHKNLRTSTHRMDLAVEAMREYRPRGEMAARGMNAVSESPLTAFDAKAAKLEKTLAIFLQIREVLEETWPRKMSIPLAQGTYRQLRDLIFEAIACWELPGLESLRQSIADPLRVEQVQALQEGAGFIGRSVRPPSFAPLFEARSDPAMVEAILKSYSEFSPQFPPSAENLMETYLQAVGSSYMRLPGRSLTHQISPSALFSVLTPAYLQANLRNPTRVLRELVTLPSVEQPELRDAWRVATYMALRLMQGARPDLALLQELRRNFLDSTMAHGLNRLIHLQVEVDSPQRRSALLEWEASPELRNRVLLGIYAFMQSPGIMKGALKSLPLSAVDPHQIAERVAGMLSSVHGTRNPLSTPPNPMVVFELPRELQHNDTAPASERPPMSEKDMTSILGSAFDPQLQGAKVENFWRDWAKQLGVKIEPREAEGFNKGLQRVPGFFYGLLSYYAVVNPTLAKVMMVELKILPPKASVSGDPELQAALSKKVRDHASPEDWKDFTNSIVYRYERNGEAYFPEKFKPLNDQERLQWYEKIGDLPVIIAEAMTEGGLQSANFLVMAHRFGLSQLGIPERDYIVIEE